jgi:predicted small lipoprotein YifL
MSERLGTGRAIALMLVLAAAVSACGRRGGLELPVEEARQQGAATGQRADSTPSVLGLPTPGDRTDVGNRPDDPMAMTLAVPPSGAEMNRQLSESLGVASTSINASGPGGRTQIYQPTPPPNRPFVLDPLL